MNIQGFKDKNVGEYIRSGRQKGLTKMWSQNAGQWTAWKDVTKGLTIMAVL